ncbi:hypothetical protein P9A16_07065 [Shinella sp. 838]|uniref:hypothetical protein n=1 Tax=Shinella sp. 838 TaxID=3038164 RepID=UPI002415765A|nr:hypothetical protein [Shinella sp. 838]MDG4670877.1 hypothetical protein [Shinella sp. 838]
MDSDKQNGVYTYFIYGAYDGMNLMALGQYIVDSADILSFWNHLPVLYAVKTRLSALDLTQKLRPFFDGRFFIVAEIDSSNMNGWMPREAWDWFKTPAPTVKPSSPPSWVADILGLPKPQS